jgi:hypothetical protein
MKMSDDQKMMTSTRVYTLYYVGGTGSRSIMIGIVAVQCFRVPDDPLFGFVTRIRCSQSQPGADEQEQ